MAAEIPELIISYLIEELTPESITTSVKKTISIKGTQEDDSVDGVHDLAHKHARKKTKLQRHPTGK